MLPWFNQRGCLHQPSVSEDCLVTRADSHQLSQKLGGTATYLEVLWVGACQHFQISSEPAACLRVISVSPNWAKGLKMDHEGLKIVFLDK